MKELVEDLRTEQTKKQISSIEITNSDMPLRKLAAIMFVDIVAFSKMMGTDEGNEILGY